MLQLFKARFQDFTETRFKVLRPCWITGNRSFSFFHRFFFGLTPFQANSDFVFIVHVCFQVLLFLLYVFFIMLVVVNLLNGLAVSDIAEIRAKAEVMTHVARVEVISYTESMLLGIVFRYVVKNRMRKCSKNGVWQFYVKNFTLLCAG